MKPRKQNRNNNMDNIEVYCFESIEWEQNENYFLSCSSRKMLEFGTWLHVYIDEIGSNSNEKSERDIDIPGHE